MKASPKLLRLLEPRFKTKAPSIVRPRACISASSLQARHWVGSQKAPPRQKIFVSPTAAMLLKPPKGSPFMSARLARASLCIVSSKAASPLVALTPRKRKIVRAIYRLLRRPL